MESQFQKFAFPPLPCRQDVLEPQGLGFMEVDLRDCRLRQNRKESAQTLAPELIFLEKDRLGTANKTQAPTLQAGA